MNALKDTRKSMFKIACIAMLIFHCNQVQGWSFYASLKSYGSSVINSSITSYLVKTAAACIGLYACAALYFKYGNYFQEQQIKALFKAIENDDIEGVRKNISATSIDATPEEYDLRPLSFACQRGNIKIIELLMQNNASRHRKYPLIQAAKHNHTHVVKFLLENGFDMKQGKKQLERAMEEAIHNNNPEMIELLLMHGADINGEGSRKSSRWMDNIIYKATKYNFFELAVVCDAPLALKTLLKHCNSSFFKNKLIESAYRKAIKENKKQMLKILITDPNAGISMRFEDGDFPLMTIVQEDKPELFLLFREIVGISQFLTQLKRHGNAHTPLIRACYFNRISLVKTMIFLGADINAPDSKDGLKPVHYAMYCGHEELFKMLIYLGADLALPNLSQNPFADDVAQAVRERMLEIYNAHNPRQKIIDDGYNPIELKNEYERAIKQCSQERYNNLWSTFNNYPQLQEVSAHNHITKIEALKPTVEIINSYLAIDEGR